MTAPAIAPAPTVSLDIEVQQKDLLDSLKFVASALPAHPPMKVLLGIRLEMLDAGLQLSAFDYEVSAHDIVPGTGHGEALVPGKLLLDIVKSLDPGLVQLLVTDGRLTITQQDLTFSLPTLVLEDYPALPTSAGKRLATVSGAQLAELNRVAIAVGRDDTLPVLTGIRLETVDGQLVAAATDRYRLAVLRSTIPALDLGGALVPRQTLALVTKQFAKAEGVALRIDRPDGSSAGTLVAQEGNRIITARLLEGEFPRYQTLIPEQFTVAVTVDITTFVKAAKQVIVTARNHEPVRLGISEKGVLLETGNADDAAGRKLVKGTLDGDPLTAAFNPAYLIDGLLAQGKKGARLRFNAPTRPMVIDEPDDPTFLYLLMPVRMSG